MNLLIIAITLLLECALFAIHELRQCMASKNRLLIVGIRSPDGNAANPFPDHPSLPDADRASFGTGST